MSGLFGIFIDESGDVGVELRVLSDHDDTATKHRASNSRNKSFAYEPDLLMRILKKCPPVSYSPQRVDEWKDVDLEKRRKAVFFKMFSFARLESLSATKTFSVTGMRRPVLREAPRKRASSSWRDNLAFRGIWSRSSCTCRQRSAPASHLINTAWLCAYPDECGCPQDTLRIQG